jgi:hypothetical protein
MQFSRRKRREFRSVNACAEVRLRTGEFLACVDEVFFKFLKIVRSAVGQIPLEVCPYSFVWIKIRGIGRKTFQVETREAPAEFTNRFPPVGRKIVPQHEHVTS